MNALTEQLSNDVARLTRQNERLASALGEFADMDIIRMGNRMSIAARDEFLKYCPEYKAYCKTARTALDEAKEKP